MGGRPVQAAVGSRVAVRLVLLRGAVLARGGGALCVVLLQLLLAQCLALLQCLNLLLLVVHLHVKFDCQHGPQPNLL